MPDHFSDKNPLLIIRVDASKTLGGGHVMRCLALAEAARGRGWSCVFAVNPEAPEVAPALARSECNLLIIESDGPAGADELKSKIPDGCGFLVVDHYGLDHRFEAGLRDWAGKILAVDDLIGRRHDCDLLLNTAAGFTPEDYRDSVPKNCEMLLGPKYALLRSEFSRNRERSLSRRFNHDKVERILIGFGTLDLKNLAPLTLEALKMIDADVRADIVIGPTAPNLKKIERAAAESNGRYRVHVGVGNISELMAESDLALGAGGVTTLERCCLGLPSLVVISSDNQERMIDALAGMGAVASAGKHDRVTARILAGLIDGLVNDAVARRELSRRGSEICDGMGASRVLDELNRDRIDHAA